MDINKIITELRNSGLSTSEKIFWNCTPEELIELSVLEGEGTLTNTGALNIKTGKFTGRSPKDRYIVRDSITENSVFGEASIFLLNLRFF